MLVNKNTKFNAENIVKILNNTDVKQIEKSYASIFDTETATETTEKTIQQMTLDIVRYLAENQLRQEVLKSKFGKYQTDKIKLIEKTLDKIRKNNTGKASNTSINYAYIDDNGNAFLSSMYWVIKTTSKELEGIDKKYIITDETKGDCTILDYSRVVPKHERLDIKKVVTAKEIKDFIKLHGKDYDKNPFVITVNEGTKEEFKYYLKQENIELLFKFYGTEKLNFFISSKNFFSLVVSPVNEWNEDSQFAVMTVLRPSYFEKRGENK